MKEEMKRMHDEYELANERFASLKEKYDQLQYDCSKDKNFYEEALEARMNQLEQFEADNEQLNMRVEESRRKELDLQAKCD